MQSNQLGTFGIKHGGRCLHINDTARKTRDVDVSSVFFLFNEVHQQNQNIMYRSPVTLIPSPMEYFEFKKDFLVGGASQDLFSWRECCPELKLICRGSINTHALGPLLTPGRNIKVTILTDNNFVEWQCKWWVIVSHTTARTRIYTFCNNGDCTILWPCNVVQQCISVSHLHIRSRLICDVNSKLCQQWWFGILSKVPILVSKGGSSWTTNNFWPIRIVRLKKESMS